MVETKIEIDIDSLRQLSKGFSNGLTEAAFPNTARAFKSAVHKVHNTWTDYLNGEDNIPGLKPLKQTESDVAQSIEIDPIGDFDVRIYTNHPRMKIIDGGTPSVDYDMKKTHPYGPKSRVAKTGKNKGIPYLIIPFRWGSPNGKGTKRAHFNNFIPQKEYNTMVKGLNISQRNSLKDYLEANFKGHNVNRSGYDWAKNGRITEDMALNSDDERFRSYAQGMVRMKNLTKSQYFTFRIISANSPAGSWMYHRDGKPGNDFIKHLARATEPDVRKIIQQGIEADEKNFSN